MKFKREIIIITLIIAMLFTVSTVCAVDSEIQAISAHNSTDTVVSTANDDSLKMNDANEILAETDDGSFAALNTKISGATAGSTVYLENDYEYSSTDTITGGISINKNLIIDGKGHTIDAKQKSRIFSIDVEDTVDLTLKNIIFKNGKAGYGGAIYWAPDDGDGDIINCTFIDNRATGTYYSGAIYEYTGISNIINSTFINNYDSKGGLYLSSTKIINSVFLNNGETTIKGQNIEADYNWFGNTIDNYDTVPSVDASIALNNWYVLNMTTNGANNVATLTLNNLYDRSEIKPCDSYALPSVTFDVEGTNATLTKDTVTLDSNGKASFGFTVTEDTGKLTASSDGISLSKDVVNMADDGSMATLNTKITDAISNGESEVKLYNDYVYSDSEPIVTNTIYNGNTNKGIGIATDFTIDGQGFTIDGNNKGGRIIYFRDASKNLILKNINFVNCYDQYGSAVYVTCNNLEIINCTFTEGTATANSGAGIYASVYGNYNIKNSNFTNNKITASNKKGGAITLFTNSGTTGEIVYCSFINNQVNDYGGALYITSNGGVGGDTGSISGCTFKGNVASKGSSLYLYSPGSYTLTNSILLDEGNIIFSNNAFNIDNNWWGSTVDDYSNLQVNATYENQQYIPVNKWLYLDIVVDNENAKATVSLNNLNDGTVYENYALPEITLNIQVTNANINTNTITLDENGQATVNYEMTDKTGTLTVSYGDIEITKEIKLFVQDSFTSLKKQINETDETTFTLNQNYNYNSGFDDGLTNGIEITKSITVDGKGYAIDAKGLSNIFYFDDNTNTKNLILKNIIFVNATTTTNGAAVYFKGNKIEIINCTFINNKANSQGDAVYVADASSSENKITESRFINNSGENSVVHINLEFANAKLNLNNSIFLSNGATYDVKGNGEVIADYNWWGTTTEDYTANSPKVDGATLYKWYVLNVTANTNTNVATVSLNNLYDGNTLTVYENYALPAIKFNVKGTGVIPDVNIITLSDGSSTFGFTLDVPDSSLTLGYGGIWQTTTEMHYVIVDDGSFKALYDLIRLTPENGVLELTKNYTYSETDTITPGIPITKTITINGNDNTINADGKSGIFIINSDNIAFNDIIFINGVSENGGAIYSTVDYKYLNIDNCTFINNTATNTDGGAIWSGSYYFGSVTNSKFINNTAVEDGGAIFTKSFYTDATIEKCTFINNSAQYSSTIYAYYLLECHNSVFLNNTGGQIITGYYSSYHHVGNNWWGNTFDNLDTKPNVKSSIYNWLYLDIKFLEDVAIVSLNNLYTSSSSSASVYSSYDLPEITLNINSTTLNLNTDKITLDSTGKAIVPYTKIVDDAKLTVSNGYVSLTKDTLVGDFDVLQYLVDEASANDVINLTRDYTYVEGVDTLTKGISITKDVTIDGKGHTIDAKGLSRIFNINDNSNSLCLVFKNINFINGKSINGGAVYFKGNTIEFENCTFKNSVVTYDGTYSTGFGGAVYLDNYGSKFVNCSFINNTLTTNSKQGGAVYINDNGGVNNFTSCIFINNTATYFGGSIATSIGNSILSIDKGIFINNKGTNWVYCIGGSSAEFYLNNSIILGSSLLDTTSKIYVQYTLKKGDVNNNWWMNTKNNFNSYYARYAGGNLTVTKWLFLDMNCEDDTATISLNNVYDKNTGTSSYGGELPQITFCLSGVNVDIEDNATSNKNGIAQAEYDLTGKSGSVTASYYTVSITKPVVFEDTFSSLQKLINKASEGSQLLLPYNYTYNSTWDSGLIEGIIIDKDLTIDGQGYTIDAMDASRIFKIDDNTKNIVLKNIKFINASGDNGAAVYANCNNIEVINCTFEDNQATTNGDALYVIANGCDITESIFINNTGTASALYLSSNSQDAPFSIDNSILVNNAGTNIVKDDEIALTANNNWWGNTVDNTADLSASLAQNWYLLDMTVDDSQSIATISLNNLWDGSAYSPFETYALPTITLNMQATNGAVRKGNVTVDKNGDTVSYMVTDSSGTGTLTASYNGVSIEREIHYDEDNDYSFKALKKLIDEYQDNDVIVLPHDYEYVIGYDDITNGITIAQNYLTIDGNGHTIDAKGQTRIFQVGTSSGSWDGRNVTIINTTFANGKVSGYGGAIRWYADNGTLANCTFIANEATGSRGGSIYVDSAKNLTIDNITVVGSKASDGGAIWFNGDNGTVINSRFINNSATINGGAIYWVNGKNGVVINSSFTDNKGTYGGALYWANENNGAIVNSSFTGNTATRGGAIYWAGSANKFGIIYNSTFTKNSAIATVDVYGGAIYLYNGNLIISDSDFINNSAYCSGSHASYGGAVFVFATAGTVEIDNSNFISNFASGKSGNLILGGAANGGAIEHESSNSISITNSSFLKNSVIGVSGYTYGGAIGTKGPISIHNSTFDRNLASAGGSNYAYASAIYLYCSKAQIDNSSIINNYCDNPLVTVTVANCAIYSNGPEANITNSIFLNNTNRIGTLHVYIKSGTVNFTTCWFGDVESVKSIDISSHSTDGFKNFEKTLYMDTDPDYDKNNSMIVSEDNELHYVFNYLENVNSSNKVFTYDSSKLPKIDLALSSVNGTIDKDFASMNESIMFNPNQFGPASITAKFNGIEFTKDLYAKAKAVITIDSITVHVGETVSVNVIEKLPQDADLHYYCAGDTQEDEFILVYANGGVVGKSEGNTTLYVKYNGNDDYAPTTVEVPVTVIKYNTELVTLIDSNPVDSIAVDWGAEPQSIQIGILSDDPNPDYTGLSLNYASNNTEVAKVTINPRLITFGAAGTANITFSTQGNEKYYGSEKNITVTVRKVVSSVDLSKTDLEFGYGGSDSTTLTLVGCSVDDVNITVEGHPEVVIGFENNVITVSGLDAGTYILKITSTPDENHTSVTETADITVTKVDSSVEFENNVEFDYLGTGTTKLINFVGCSVDLVNITVEGQTGATVGYDDVTKVITVSGLDAGTYTLKVSTTPDGNHKSVDVNADITVNRIDSSVKFADIEFDYLGSGTTTITAYDGCTVDLVNITVVGRPNAVIGFENDVITVSGLGAGTHSLNVTTTPDANHKSKSVLGNIKVNKIPSQITLNSTDITYEYVKSNSTKLTLVGCSVDLVNITVDGNNVAGVTYEGETKVITLSGIDCGTHELKVVTTPDENHTSVYATASVTVEKSNSSVGFSNPVSLFYSEEGTTTLILNGCSVNLADISVIEDSNAVIAYDDVNKIVTVSNLNIGTYTLKVVTSPDSNHYSVENTTTISVGKENPKLTMEYGNITVGEKELVYVSLGTAGEVNIKISKDSAIIENENVTIDATGFNKITFDDLKVGTYDITAYYKGMGRYNDSTLKYKLVVRPIYEYEFTAVASNALMGNRSNVTVTLPAGATGKIKIGGIEKDVEGTETFIDLGIQTKLGKNDITVKYIPDENSKYAERELTVLYDVDKVDTAITLTIDSTTTANPVTVTASINAEGNVIFDVNGTKYSREISAQGQAVLELTNVAGGKYDVTAIYEGSEKYGNSSANSSFTVNKVDPAIPQIVIDANPINTDETARVTVTVDDDASGIVTFSVNGVETNVTVNNEHKAVLALSNLPKNSYAIKAKYLGDGKYKPSDYTDAVTLTVNPISDYKFDIEVANITVGEDAIVYVFLPSDATNNVNVTVTNENGVSWSQNTTSKVIISNLNEVGTYSIIAKYYGDGKYDEKVNNTVKFSVKPLNVGKLDFVVKVNDTTIGETTNVTVTLPADATGNIVIDGTSHEIKGTETIIELPVQTTAGLNNVTVEYVPDANSKYTEDEVTAFYNVAKINTTISINLIGIKVAGETVTVTVNTNSDNTPVIFVDGVETSSVENIAFGNHTVVASVAESDNHLAASANLTFNVVKNKVGIFAVVPTPNEVKIGQNVVINVNIQNQKGDNIVDGIVLINVNGAEYSLNISKNKQLELVMDKTGDITLSATYLENDMYDAKNSNEASIKVIDKSQANIEVTGIPSEINAGDSFNVTVTSDNPEIVVYVDGKKQTLTGGKYPISNIAAGIHNITVVAAENPDYYAGEVVKTFTANKKQQTITIDPIDVKAGDNVTVTATSDSGEIPVIYIDGEKTDTVTNISAGTHTVVASVAETDKYLAASANYTFTVDKYVSEIKSADAKEVIMDADSTIEVVMNSYESGFVIIEIDGVNYTAPIKDAKASLNVTLDKTTNGTVYYLGDYKYCPAAPKEFEAVVNDKAESIIVIDGPTLTIGESATVTATVNGNNVSVYINGVEGNEIAEVKAITYVVTATFEGNSTHKANSTSKTFTVSKLDVDLSVSGTPVKVGGKSTITVNITDGATGTVIVNVNGTEYSLDIAKTKTLEVAMDNVGNAQLSARYLGDDKYNAKEVTGNSIKVTDKANSNIDVTGIPSDINAGDPFDVGVTSDNPEFEVYYDGVKQPVSNGKVVIQSVEAGVHNITVIAKENSAYYGDTVIKTFTATKKQQTITIEPITAKAGDKITVKATSDSGETPVIFVDGVKTATVSNIAAGTHTVVASVGESDEYLASNATYTFTATKYDSQIKEVNVNPVIKDEKSTIEVVMSAGESGFVIVEIDGVNYTKPISNAKASLEIALESTTTGKVYYLGDERYNAASSKTFTAVVNEKSDSIIKINDPELTIGKSAAFTATVNGKAPAVAFTINGVETSTIDKVEAATYVVTAVFEGNATHKANATSKTFTVAKKDVDLSVSGTPTKVGEKSAITVEITDGATGTVIVNVNGTEYSLDIAKTKTLDVSMDNIGNVQLSARYLGDDKYNAKEVKGNSIKVTDKDSSALTVEVPEDAKAGEPVVIKVASESGADVEVYIDGVKQTVKNGKVTVNSLPAGPHTIEALSPETPTSKANSTYKTLTVSKKESNVEITVLGDLVVDKNIQLDIKSYSGADIEVYMDGKKLDNWQSPFKADAGEHLVLAAVGETDEYLASSANCTFNVAKKESEVFISAGYAVVGENSIIDVELPEDATGMVIVSVNATEYSLNISEAKSLSIALAKAGTYDVSAKYLGDDRYLPGESETDTLIVGDKKNSEISIYSPSQIYAGDDVEIEVVSTGDASLEVYLDGVKQTLKDNKFTIENIASGTHLIEAVSPETSKYNYNSTSKRINVDKKQSKVTITIPNTIEIGKNVTIEFATDSDAEIQAYVDGEKQTLTSGKVTVRATAGEHSVAASVGESDRYLASSANRTFTVNKLDSQIAVSAQNITEGQTTTITLTTDAGEGLVIVKVGDKELAVDLAKAKSANVKLDIAGSYELSANYMGTDIYNTAEAAKSTINVVKKTTSSIDVSIPEIKANESKQISISIPNATGEVSVIVDGVEDTVTLDKNGRATYTLPVMGAGGHSVVVTYPGDETSTPAVSTKSFNVTKQATKANITVPSDLSEGENATVKVEIPGAKGEVSVIVDGKENKVALTNGSVEYPLSNLSGGDHSVVVIYPGDETHDATYASSSFNVAEEPVIIKKASEFSDITIDENLAVSIVLKDSDGNPISDVPITYFRGNAEGTVWTESDGSFTIRGENGATITIVYEGNETITGTNTTLKLSLPAAPTTVKVASHFNIDNRAITINGYAVDTYAGEEGINYVTTLLDADGKPISNAYLEFAVNNKIYNRTTYENGSFAPYKLNMLRAGRYTMAFNFAGDDNYTNAFACVCVDLDKKPITIKASAKTFKAATKTKKFKVTLSTIVGSSHDGKVHMKSGMKVTLTVDGVTYNGLTNSKGQVTFKINKLSKQGKYTAKIYYKGDKTYEEAEKSVSITIK